jgi:hypothetical protein
MRMWLYRYNRCNHHVWCRRFGNLRFVEKNLGSVAEVEVGYLTLFWAGLLESLRWDTLFVRVSEGR